VTAHPRRTIIADANVLINLMHVNRLALCSNLPGCTFVVPDHVVEEITNGDQKAKLDDALARGIFHIVAIKTIDTITLFAELTTYVGRGEAACLALAVERNWIVASDEKRRFRREAVNRIGSGRIIGTRDLYVLAIQAGLITVEEADADKGILEQLRFKMDFKSFQDLVIK